MACLHDWFETGETITCTSCGVSPAAFCSHIWLAVSNWSKRCFRCNIFVRVPGFMGMEKRDR